MFDLDCVFVFLAVFVTVFDIAPVDLLDAATLRAFLRRVACFFVEAAEAFDALVDFFCAMEYSL